MAPWRGPTRMSRLRTLDRNPQAARGKRREEIITELRNVDAVLMGCTQASDSRQNYNGSAAVRSRVAGRVVSILSHAPSTELPRPP
eukprot:6278470-Pyramimonas_sp.AAC.1